VAPHEQDAGTGIVQQQDHDAAPHPEDVLGECGAVRQFNIGEADTDVRILVNEPLTVDDPAGVVGSSFFCH
jgi:hypothetical protein